MDDLISRKSLLEKTHMANMRNAYENKMETVEIVLADDVEVAPSAFEGMTNGEVFQAIFPCDEVHINGLQEGCVHFSMKSNLDTMDCFDLDWWNAPYKGVSE